MGVRRYMNELSDYNKRIFLKSRRWKADGSEKQKGRLAGCGKSPPAAFSPDMPPHRLGGVRKRDVHYSSRHGSRCGLAWDKARLGAPRMGG